MIDCEGAIEEGVRKIHKAMSNKEKKEVTLTFLCTSEWMHLQFLTYMAYYLGAKKAKKVGHVKVDIYIEQKEED
jgi:hypothetical protein